MNMCKIIGLVSLFTLVTLMQSNAGLANKNNNDRLINSYLIVEELSRDGNLNAISNKKTMYIFLTKDQKDKVHKIITMKLSNKLNF